MEYDVKQYLDSIEGRIAERLNAVAQHLNAVPERLNAVADRVYGRIDAVEERLNGMEGRMTEHMDGRNDAVEERLKDYIRQSNHDLETKLITEFHEWGRTSEMRTRQAITDVGLLGERLLAAEDRISAPERGDTGRRTA